MLTPIQMLIDMATSFPSLGFIAFWLGVGALLFRLTTR